MDNKESTDFHNEITQEVVKRIVKGTDMDFSSSMVIVESIVFGVLLFYEKANNVPRAVSMDRLYEGIQGRLNDA